MTTEKFVTQIGDWEYCLRGFGFGQGRKVLLRFLKLLGCSLDDFTTSEKGKEAIEFLIEAFRDKENKVTDLDLGLKFSGLLSELLSNLEDADLDFFFSSFGVLCEATLLSDDKISKRLTIEAQDSHFKGKYKEALQWLAWCFKVNFAGFLV